MKEENHLLRKQLSDEQSKYLLRRPSQGNSYTVKPLLVDSVDWSR